MRLFGSSGIRARYDQNLLETAFKVGLVVGINHKNIIVGRDTRTTGDAMKHAVMAGLLASGAKCADAGITPTPTLAYATREFDAGVMITASHNPPEYNGLKLLNRDGSSFDALQQAQIENALSGEAENKLVWGEARQGSLYPNAVENHINAILPYFPPGRNVKIVVDAGCGAAAEVTPKLLTKMGYDVIALNCYHSGFFPRGIEPNEENLKELCKAVKKNGAAAGIAHDGDADRMMAVDEKGRFITGDKLLAVLIRAVGAKDAVTTLDASMVIDDIGIKIRRTKIGDTWVSEELRKGGDFGGETAGAWIFPKISLCPDGIYAAAVLASLAAENRLAELVNAVKVYPLVRGSTDSEDVSLEKLEAGLMALQPLKVSKIDGFKLDFNDGWLLVRPSGTEPKIRLTAEAKTKAKAQQYYDQALAAIENSIDIGVKAS
jgi:phosphoglucosamine mutase